MGDLDPFRRVEHHDVTEALTVTAETAKEVFVKAIEWHVVYKHTDVSISDGIKCYSIDGFASQWSLQEMTNTVEAGVEPG